MAKKPSKRYQAALKLVEVGRQYSLEEAADKIKKLVSDEAALLTQIRFYL